MLIKKCIGFVVPILFLCSLVFANTEHIIWDKRPINITLSINQERLVVFPTKIEVDASDSLLSSQQLRLLNNDGTLYLTAYEKFSTQRLKVRSLVDGKTILLDIESQQDGNNSTLYIVWPNENDTTTIYAESPKTTLGLTQLNRFAIQAFFAPERLLTKPSDIHRVPMNAPRTLRLIPGDSVMANPRASWRQGNRYITAVELRNKLTHEIILDHRQVLGNWQTILFYPSMTLSAYRSVGDSTMVFLISKRPFMESLR